MKTPEEMAEQYADDKSRVYYIGENGEKEWYISSRGQHSKEDFLAGYKAAQQWISVKDRLPTSTPMVLAMCTDGYELAYYGNYGKGQWTNILGTENLNVTHWMPLPTPPKEEK